MFKYDRELLREALREDPFRVALLAIAIIAILYLLIFGSGF
jgi:hypothetical protein